MNEKCLYTLYCLLLISYMSYCAEIWGIVYKTHIDSVIKLQKRALRIIHKADYCEFTNHLFIASGHCVFKNIGNTFSSCQQKNLLVSIHFFRFRI